MACTVLSFIRPPPRARSALVEAEAIHIEGCVQSCMYYDRMFMTVVESLVLAALIPMSLCICTIAASLVRFV